MSNEEKMRCGGYSTTSRIPNEEERSFLTSDVVRQLIEDSMTMTRMAKTTQTTTAETTESDSNDPKNPLPKQKPLISVVIDPILIKMQVVAGMNYHVKYHITQTQQEQEQNDGEKKTTRYIHAKIYKPLPHTNNPPTLTSFVDNCTETDEL